MEEIIRRFERFRDAVKLGLLTVLAVAAGLLGGASTTHASVSWDNVQTNDSSIQTYSAKYGGGYWVVGGESSYWVSLNGTNWNEYNSISNLSVKSVAYNGTIWVIVGQPHYTGASTIMRSATSAPSFGNPSGTQVTDGLCGVAYGNGKFVAVGYQGAVYTSSTGDNWAKQTVGTTTLMSIVYGDGKFVAVGYDGSIWTSADGSSGSWTERDPDGHYWSGLNAVAYSGDSFIAVGTGGIVISSPDGITWTLVQYGLGGTYIV
ncbi:hypothetical protein [Paenibacillus hexagrammi]|uniref:Uncharacterized protein n=1 Tax=Paenibacillus hexagrammi TaxID=2908839 RepID=A0ABY3SIX1_9BACL|nr:hypothetical protein [Paenibacillus sp. YPD9-1]UJF33982.1 hypothetical protein L0M14_01700 [Paenibacillus sp. YPD9-1]